MTKFLAGSRGTIGPGTEKLNQMTPYLFKGARERAHAFTAERFWNLVLFTLRLLEPANGRTLIIQCVMFGL
jgi:hypothetical protein